MTHNIVRLVRVMMGARQRPRGQVLSEFTIMLAMMISVVMMMALFIAVFTEYGHRLLRLIALELP